MKKFENGLYKIMEYATGILILVMALLIFVQVVFRYIMNDSLTWSEELGRYIFVWITFIGTPVALKYGAQVAIDLLLLKTKGKFHMAIFTINSVVTALLGLVICYSGTRLFLLGQGQISSAMQIPMHYVYAIIPVSGLVLCFFAFTMLLDEWKKFQKGEI